MKIYKYQLYPTKVETVFFDKWLENLRWIYNCALEDRIQYYKKTKQTKSAYAQSSEFTQARNLSELEELKQYSCASQHYVFGQLDKVYQNFFRKIKKGEKTSFPRFLKYDRFSTFFYQHDTKTYKNPLQNVCGKNAIMKFPKCPGEGTKVVYHRPVPRNSKVKKVGLTKQNSKYFLLLVVDDTLSPKTSRSNAKSGAIGIDVGLKTFATLSNGKKINPPTHLKEQNARDDKEIKRLQRKLSWRVPKDGKPNGREYSKRGSNRRRVLIARLRKIHQKKTLRTENWQHKITKDLTAKYKEIYVEKISQKSMREKNNTAMNRKLDNVSWFRFAEMLKYKALVFGKVNPKNTTQRCSKCGNILKGKNKLVLEDRIYNCSKCGYIEDRDVNAAKNILDKGQGKW